ncbi:hypothetical protein HZ994_16695 [Akkermansiaceae bacterium]|nr:hypothetical protein HZ994_16695 [Akkermansiaceae bacterium]
MKPPTIFLAIVLSGFHARAATITLDFESQTPGSSVVPTGWSYVHSGVGAPATNGTYTTTAASGGSTGSGLGGVLVGNNPTHGTNLPYSFLVNSGSTNGFDVRQSITGTYDFLITNGAQYDTAGFLFGDIKGGTISGSNAGQFLSIQHANGGFGQATAESRIVDGANVATYAPTGNAGFADNTWYRSSFTWTPTSGTTGDLSYTATRWNGSTWVAHSTFGITAHTFDNPEAFVGVADLWGTSTTFDNISVTGTLVPEPSAAFLGGLGALLLLRRRRG